MNKKWATVLLFWLFSLQYPHIDYEGVQVVTLVGGFKTKLDCQAVLEETRSRLSQLRDDIKFGVCKEAVES